MPTYPTSFFGACHRNQTYFFIWPNQYRFSDRTKNILRRILKKSFLLSISIDQFPGSHFIRLELAMTLKWRTRDICWKNHFSIFVPFCQV